MTCFERSLQTADVGSANAGVPGAFMSNSASRKRAANARQKQIEGKVVHFPLGHEPPRFVADVMLGKLAKWLRIAGFDVLYSNKFSDNELIRISASENRVLLSRDTRLLIQKAVRRFIFLESQDLQQQIQQVFEAMHLARLPSLLTRCLSCNEPLQETARESVRDIVPPFVFETQSKFKLCPRCGKIFWVGTHRKAVVRSLEKIIEK
jgi:uncharacterized protein with PIN domain